MIYLRNRIKSGSDVIDKKFLPDWDSAKLAESVVKSDPLTAVLEFREMIKQYWDRKWEENLLDSSRN